MKLFKKITIGFLTVLLLALFGSYFYLDQKFTPENNYLTVKNESGNIPITWLGSNKNVLLLPIHFKGNLETYYLQFDTGSPYTIFYLNSITDIRELGLKNNCAKTSFFIGKSEISSDQFKIFKTKKVEKNDSIKIIGTLGADILEDRKTIINFKENLVILNVSNIPYSFKNRFINFKFKKRKIIIPGILKGEERNSSTTPEPVLTNF